MTRFLDVVAGFGSFVVIPFLGALTVFKIRVFPILATFCVVWFILGVFLIGGGVTPVGPGDIVTPEDRVAWFATPWVRWVSLIWLTGLAISIPLLAISWAHEHRHLSRAVRLISDVISIVTLVAGIWSFVKYVVLPRV